jgi:hypothetical protein
MATVTRRPLTCQTSTPSTPAQAKPRTHRRPQIFCRRALGRADFAGARFVIEYLKDWKTFRPLPLPVSSISAMTITAAASLCATRPIDRKGGAPAEIRRLGAEAEERQSRPRESSTPRSDLWRRQRLAQADPKTLNLIPEIGIYPRL